MEGHDKLAQDTVNAVGIRYNIRAAAAWGLLCKIFRLFQKQNDFRLIEVHPHSYDCLGISNDPLSHRRIDFHLSDGSVKSHGYELETKSGIESYVIAALKQQTLIEYAIRFGRIYALGEPHDVGMRVHALTCMEIIAAVMERYAFRDVALEARAGWARFEEGDEIRPWLHRIPWAAEKLKGVSKDDTARRAEIGRRVWRLNRAPMEELHSGSYDNQPSDENTAILDFSTGELVIPSMVKWQHIPVGAMVRERKITIRECADLVDDAINI